MLINEVYITVFTTSREDYTDLWRQAHNSEYVASFKGELWSWEGGAKLYLIKVELLVNTRLPQVLVERYFRIKLKADSYSSSMHNNSGTSKKETLPESFYTHKAKVISLKPKKSLLSTDITKVKRLSLRKVTLPTIERRVEPITPILVERPPSDEEIAYSKLIAINPLIEELVERLDLVSIKTGERIKKIDLKEDSKHKLIALAQRIIKGEDSYIKEDIITRIKEATNVNQERAERGFNLLLKAGAIEPTLGNSYYLTGSTPF
jgi:hypothetical protein